MKQILNTFEKGMNSDISPLKAPEGTYRYARNIDITTAGSGNQLIIQKRDGNEALHYNNILVGLASGYVPLAIKELNNVFYIISYNESSNRGEIGTFPSPQYYDDDDNITAGTVTMVDKYQPLNNFHDGSDAYEDVNFHSAFRSTLFNFDADAFIDLQLQKIYDGSVNLIFTSTNNPTRIVNTRFSSNGRYATLITRRTGNSLNSYSNTFFSQTEIIPKAASIPKLVFNGTTDGGKLESGSYRYFFKYVNTDGGTTDVIEESRMVPIFRGEKEGNAIGTKPGETTSKSVSFTLSNLNASFYGIKVYYTFYTGEAQAISVAKSIDSVYRITSTGTCTVTHTGYESLTDYSKDDISSTYSPISKARTLEVINDRLVLANTETAYTSEEILGTSFAGLKIAEKEFNIYHSASETKLESQYAPFNYANTKFIYDNLGYWKGETYEIGIVGITDTGLTPVYPIQGLDRLNSSIASPIAYPSTLKEFGDTTFGTDGTNSLGVYRTSHNNTLYSVTGNTVSFKGTALQVDVTDILARATSFPGYTTTVLKYGLKLVHHAPTNMYYVWGVVDTPPVSNLLFDLESNDDNPNHDVPTPIQTIRVGNIEVQVDGKVYNRGYKDGDNLTELLGPPVDVRSVIKGFFFVRRNRIKDKIYEGIVVPTAAFPPESNAGLETEFSTCGGWLGCGNSTKLKGENVILAPTPMLCLPLSVEESEISVPADTTDEWVNLVRAGKAMYTTKITPVTFSIPNVVLTVNEIPSGLPDYIRLQGVNLSPSYPNGMPVISYDINTKTITVPSAAFESSGILQEGKNIQQLELGTDKILNRSGVDFIYRAPILNYDTLKSWALYSPDADMVNNSEFSGTERGISVQGNILGNINETVYSGGLVDAVYDYVKLDSGSSLALNASTTYKYSSTLTSVGAGGVALGGGSFSGVLDRNIYYNIFPGIGNPRATKEVMDGYIQGLHAPLEDNNFKNPYTDYAFRAGIRDGVLGYENMNADNDAKKTIRSGICVNYGSYIGVKIPDNPIASTSPLHYLNIDGTAVTNPAFTVQDARNSNYGITLSTCYSILTEGDLKYAAYTQVFNNDSRQHIDSEAWENAHINRDDVEYIAISRRYDFTEFDNGLAPVIDLYGGDCYLGLAWKQVWHPRGPLEAPFITDNAAYLSDRRALGMFNQGFAIPIPAQCNNNFNIRSPQRASEAEFSATNKDRTYLPSKGFDNIRGNRQFDTALYNTGYSTQSTSDNRFFTLSSEAPYFVSTQPNRVWISEPANESEFKNGYTIFRGINFKDYNSELGPITKLINFSNSLMVVFKSGVGVIGLQERSMISADTGSIYTDNVDLLAKKANIINNGYGSTTPESIIATTKYIYGVDLNANKVWRCTPADNSFEVISDLKVQNILTDIMTKFNEGEDDGNGNLINGIDQNPLDRWIGCYTTYDLVKQEVMFNFYIRDKSKTLKWGNTTNTSNICRTLVFSELDFLNSWICETDDHRKFFVSSDRGRFSMVMSPSKERYIYLYDNVSSFGGNNIFAGTLYDAQINYVALDNSNEYKQFNNILIGGKNNLPYKVEYLTDVNVDTNIITQTLNPATNMAFNMFNGTTPITINMGGGSYNATLSSATSTTKVLGRVAKLLPGDYISTVINGVMYNFVIISVDNTNVVLNKTSSVYGTGPLTYGYKVPLRLSDSTYEEGYSKITCIARTLQQSNIAEQKIAGTWAEIKLYFNGQDQMYINNISTLIIPSYS